MGLYRSANDYGFFELASFFGDRFPQGTGKGYVSKVLRNDDERIEHLTVEKENEAAAKRLFKFTEFWLLTALDKAKMDFVENNKFDLDIGLYRNGYAKRNSRSL